MSVSKVHNSVQLPATYFVGWCTDAITVGSPEAGFGKLARVEVEDLDGINGHAIVILPDDWQCSQMVEQPQSIGSQIDGTANGGWCRPDLEDLNVGNLAGRGKLCQRESRCQAGNTTTQDKDVESFGRGS
jgi:hypothetical protein